MKLLSLKSLAVMTALLSANAASAATLNIDSGWNRFAFGAVGTFVSKTFSFTLSGHGLLSLVDGFVSGDQFKVFVNNVSFGLTSLPIDGASSVGGNYDKAATNSNFSFWSHRFGPGTYDVTLLVADRSGTDTRNHLAAIRLDTAPVPLPATGLMLLSVLGLGIAVKRGKTA